ncbi:MAG: hypothetical protein QM368_05035 [Bacillota bacterium]|jgi:uncharacterized protein YbaR (Trm112 family)|nr:hypothetical protein [Bacillota bacterium]HHU29123.1 hypothetical protein [Bacillota bacterium]
MYYYVCCPVCNQDLSAFVDPDNPREDTVVCLQCKTFLKLQSGTEWSNDFGGEIIHFWFEKEKTD